MIAALIGRFVQHCILAEARRKMRKKGLISAQRIDRQTMTDAQISALIHGRRIAPDGPPQARQGLTPDMFRTPGVIDAIVAVKGTFHAGQ